MMYDTSGGPLHIAVGPSLSFKLSDVPTFSLSSLLSLFFAPFPSLPCIFVSFSPSFLHSSPSPSSLTLSSLHLRSSFFILCLVVSPLISPLLASFPSLPYIVVSFSPLFLHSPPPFPHSTSVALFFSSLVLSSSSFLVCSFLSSFPPSPLPSFLSSLPSSLRPFLPPYCLFPHSAFCLVPGAGGLMVACT